jgi:potassium/hydrogen antiporter
MRDGIAILAVGLMLTAALVATMLAGRSGVPSMLLFLAIGMIVGSDGLDWLDFGDYTLARRVGIICLALILFEGGLAAGYREIRPVLAASASLALVATTITAVIGGLVAAALFGLSTLEGLLLGSIVASTDGAATFGLLRGSSLRSRVRLTLEGEAGLNDPVAVLLVLGFIEWLTHSGFGVGDMLWLLVKELSIGAAAGVMVGAGSAWLLNRVSLASRGLYPIASLACAALAYGAADSLHGSGFLAVYLTGMALAGVRPQVRAAVEPFHESLALLAQLTLFLVLGLLVFPSRLGDVAIKGTVLALVSVVVARPVGVFAALPFGYSARERGVLAWAGMRGAVPVVLATFGVTAHVAHSIEFFDIVFFAVLISTLLQGLTFEPLARRLGVTARAGPASAG